MARILYDGLNVQLDQGTGVATYARTLMQAARALGHETSVLYALARPVPSDPLLREIALFDRQLRNPGVKLAIERFVHWRGGRVAALPVPLSGIVLLDPIRDRVPPVDHFLAAWDVFIRANRYFTRTGRFLEVECDPTPDIAHFTYPVPVTVRGARNLYTVHDLVPLRLPSMASMRRGYMLNLLRTLTRTADGLVAISEATRDDLVTVLGADPARIVTTAQTTDIAGLGRDDGTMGAPFGLRPGGYFLFNGAIEPKKNVGRLIEACLAADLPLPLVLVGGPGWQNERERAVLDDARLVIRHGPMAGQRQFRHLGYVSREMLARLMRHARALAFPSLHEGFGLPVLEAMTVGTPVLTGTSPALREVAGEAALLVDPLDVGAIAAALQRLAASDELCRDLSGRGPVQAELFSPERYRERIAMLYSSA